MDEKEIEFKVYDFGSIIEAVQKGEVDCIISDIYITEERQKLISFSKPYWNVVVDASGAVCTKGLSRIS